MAALQVQDEEFGLCVIRFLFDVTEPVLEPVRRRLPRGSTIDLSPLVVFFGISILSMLIRSFLG